MAKKTSVHVQSNSSQKKTSIGLSKNSRPTNRNARRMTKPYRGQGH